MRQRALGLLSLVALCGCTSVVRYSDELVSARSGRTAFVRAPATLGGVLGFVVGVPIDIAAAPLAYVVYRWQSESDRDPLSTFLFPSFVLWRVGTLVAAPVDALEWAVWRWWQPPETLTQEERERFEAELDELHSQWSDYPVTPIYPKGGG